MNISRILDRIANTVGKRLPDILFGTSMAAGLGATIYGIAITPKAIDRIMDYVIDNVPEEERRALKVSELHKLLPFKVKVRLLWKLYLPVAIGWGISLGTGIACDVMHNRREAAYATLAQVAEETLRDFKDSTKEIVGDKKYDEISAAAAQKKVEQARTNADETYYVNKKTEGFKVIDDITGRKYIVDRDQLDHVELHLNKHLYSWTFVSINDFYRALGVPPVSIGEDLGWDSQDGDIDIVGVLETAFDDDGTPIGVLKLLNNLRCRVSSYETIRLRGN